MGLNWVVRLRSSSVLLLMDGVGRSLYVEADPKIEIGFVKSLGGILLGSHEIFNRFILSRYSRPELKPGMNCQNSIQKSQSNRTPR